MSECTESPARPTYPFELVQAEKDRRPGPVERELGAVQGERQLGRAAEAAARLPHQVRGVPHARVQCGPHRRKQPVRGLEPREVQVVVPFGDLRPRELPIDKPAQLGQQHRADDFSDLALALHRIPSECAVRMKKPKWKFIHDRCTRAPHYTSRPGTYFYGDG